MMQKSKLILLLAGILIIGIALGFAANKLWLKTNNTNPSGNDNKGQILNPEPQGYEKEVNLYYANDKYIETGDEKLERVLPIKKKVKYGAVPLAEVVVRELFNNPGVEGLSTGIPEGVKLLGVEVEKGRAYVNFSSDGMHGASLQEMITVDQIVKTLTGLEEVKSVQFLVDGKVTDSLMGQLDTRDPIYVKKNVKTEELQLGEMKLHTGKDEFIQQFGQPLSTKAEQNGTVEKLEYAGFKVTITNGKVSEISTDSDRYSTPSGVKVGDSYEKVLDTYGEPSSSKKGILNYQVGLESELLHVTIIDGKVAEIRINLAC